MILEPLTNEDIAICVNYICDEFALLGSDPKKIAMKMEYAIEDKIGWKVVDNYGTILGFAAVEDFGSTSILVTSLVVNRQYRVGKATWLLFDAVLKYANDKSLVYIPIHKDMWASKLCTDGVIDKVRAREWVNRMEVRYGWK